VLLDDGADETLGRTPWDAPHPIVLETSAAAELGYEPAGDYETTLAEEVDWLVSSADGRPSPDDPFFVPMLDYEAEDRFLAAHTR
jgi:hypothetical protein